VLDLGATVCTRRAPRCEECPLSSSCAWHAARHPEPDPALPAGRQSRFEGSDRQGRGRLVAAMADGPVPLEAVDRVAGWPGERERAAAAVASLVADGLAVVRDGALSLPG
jgi:A/G-specific adenine glycosylase